MDVVITEHSTGAKQHIFDVKNIEYKKENEARVLVITSMLGEVVEIPLKQYDVMMLAK